jgi:hypothetical protein
MISAELAEEVAKITKLAISQGAVDFENGITDEEAWVIEQAQSRILGVGNEQYSEGDKQKFETMPLPKLAQYCEEEALDLVNYGVMLTIRVRRLEATINALEERLARGSFDATTN